MRILLASFFAVPEEGGAEKQGRLLACELARRGHDVTYATARQPGSERFLQGSGVRVRLLGVGPRIPGWNRTAGEWLYYTRLRRLMETHRFDLVQAQGAFEISPLALLRAPNPRTPVVVRFASLGELEFLRRHSIIGRVLWRRVLRATVSVANSRSVLDRLLNVYRLPAERCVLIENAVELPDGSTSREEVRRRLGWQRDERVVISVAKFDPLKNQIALVEAWPSVLARVPMARLVLVGDGPESRRVRRRAEALNIASTVTFCGQVPNAAVHPLLQAADLFAFPSLYEGQPNAVLEAQGYGLGCALSDISANRELAAEGTEALFFDAREPATIADVVARLCADPALAASLGCAARRRCEHEHSIDRICSTYLSLYRSLQQ